MIAFGDNLNSASMGNSFIRQIYVGNKPILTRELICPLADAGVDVFGDPLVAIDTNYVKLNNVTYTPTSDTETRHSFDFGVGGTLEITKVVDSMCIRTSTKYADYGMPVGSDSFHIILSNAITGKQVFRFAIRATSSISVIDYIVKVSVYDENDAEIISTSYQAISNIIADIMFKYNFASGDHGYYYIGLKNYDGTIKSANVVTPYQPLKLQIKNVSGRSTLPYLYFTSNDKVDGLGVYKSYSVR